MRIQETSTGGWSFKGLFILNKRELWVLSFIIYRAHSHLVRSENKRIGGIVSCINSGNIILPAVRSLCYDSGRSHLAAGRLFRGVAKNVGAWGGGVHCRSVSICSLTRHRKYNRYLAWTSRSPLSSRPIYNKNSWRRKEATQHKGEIVACVSGYRENAFRPIRIRRKFAPTCLSQPHPRNNLPAYNHTHNLWTRIASRFV